MSNPNAVFLRLDAVAYKVGVSSSWLRREAMNGNIPFVLVGKSMMFNVDQVVSTVNAMAQANSDQARAAGGEA